MYTVAFPEHKILVISLQNTTVHTPSVVFPFLPCLFVFFRHPAVNSSPLFPFKGQQFTGSEGGELFLLFFPIIAPLCLPTPCELSCLLPPAVCPFHFQSFNPINPHDQENNNLKMNVYSWKRDTKYIHRSGNGGKFKAIPLLPIK